MNMAPDHAYTKLFKLHIIEIYKIADYLMIEDLMNEVTDTLYRINRKEGRSISPQKIVSCRKSGISHTKLYDMSLEDFIEAWTRRDDSIAFEVNIETLSAYPTAFKAVLARFQQVSVQMSKNVKSVASTCKYHVQSDQKKNESTEAPQTSTG